MNERQPDPAHDPLCRWSAWSDGVCVMCEAIRQARAEGRDEFLRDVEPLPETAIAFDAGWLQGMEKGRTEEREAAAGRIIKQGVSIVAGRPSQEYIMLSLAIAAARGKGDE